MSSRKKLGTLFLIFVLTCAGYALTVEMPNLAKAAIILGSMYGIFLLMSTFKLVSEKEKYDRLQKINTARHLILSAITAAFEGDTCDMMNCIKELREHLEKSDLQWNALISYNFKKLLPKSAQVEGPDALVKMLHHIVNAARARICLARIRAGSPKGDVRLIVDEFYAALYDTAHSTAQVVLAPNNNQFRKELDEYIKAGHLVEAKKFLDKIRRQHDHPDMDVDMNDVRAFHKWLGLANSCPADVGVTEDDPKCLRERPKM